MPPKKGRKRRSRERRHDDGGEPRSEAAPSPARQAEPVRSTPSDLPKLRVRMAGFVLAVITMLLGVLNVAQWLVSGSVDVLLIGALLVVLSIVLGVLSLVPQRVRAFLSRK